MGTATFGHPATEPLSIALQFPYPGPGRGRSRTNKTNRAKDHPRAKSLHTRVLKLEWSHQSHVIDYFKAQIYFSYDKKFQHAAKVKLIPCWSLRPASIWSLVAALASTRCRTTSGARQDWIMASQVSQPRLASHSADFIRALEHFMITSVVEPAWLPSPSHESQSVRKQKARKICQGKAGCREVVKNISQHFRLCCTALHFLIGLAFVVTFNVFCSWWLPGYKPNAWSRS